MSLLLAKIGVCSDVFQGVGVVLREMPELVHFRLGVPVFVEDAFPCVRLPQRQVAELLGSRCPAIGPVSI